MNSIDDFIRILRDELGLAVDTDDLRRSLDDVNGWDSVHLLALVTVLERITGTRVSLPDALEATSLEHLYTVVSGRRPSAAP
ncbi:MULTISPECIES: acyl carrier protein [Streptomyces]|uniref:Acyl carrier protein n=1 Tax=Streptomyces tsukubensis (strain DSM 42081 / NBRC 108919 / NRRL 18488 / 9993) TaxID=1114943 RepID=I2MTQ4_STRT9|nr:MULTISPECIES: acyl carrier protein [Streptomyces]AZK92699.1 acyl carrier protein [Streptomyces tsukubensis]EIF88151.1 hypothetical protein [Streptomyces tsukubensis NRRL18488]MYS67031.1 acyl carrier protein [Streptomyces sp. SID5473]QKM71133.1 acyl carrier protein [Streptomyces tsukubensis NRRL18488]TAI41615.1 acyl carrier protein [Streptomyces tsukubensis]